MTRFVDWCGFIGAWLLVAGGAALIAVRETWSLDHAYGGGVLVFWRVAVAMLAFTASRARLRHSVLGDERHRSRAWTALRAR